MRAGNKVEKQSSDRGLMGRCIGSDTDTEFFFVVLCCGSLCSDCNNPCFHHLDLGSIVPSAASVGTVVTADMY